MRITFQERDECSATGDREEHHPLSRKGGNALGVWIGILTDIVVDEVRRELLSASHLEDGSTTTTGSGGAA